MFELRWVKKVVEKDIRPNGSRIMGYEKVLQFRAFETVDNENGGGRFWSEWRDVPTDIEGEE